MRVLMLGWEFPPHISGGLGTACFGLTRGMSELGVEVLFVLPRPVPESHSGHVRLLTPDTVFEGSSDVARRSREFDHVSFMAVDAYLRPYVSMPPPQTVETKTTSTVLEEIAAAHGAGAAWPKGKTASGLPASSGSPGAGDDYGGDMFSQVARYAHLAARIAAGAAFDVVHAHDWMTYPAGIAAARISGKPLVVHVHSTEFDRSGDAIHQGIYEVERAGMTAADRVITVSYLTKTVVTKRYGVPAAKVDVVYNAIDANGPPRAHIPGIRRDEKIVLFLGRITMQKGPDYFVRAAQRVLEVMDNVRFVMAGSGDMVRSSIELAAKLGIGHKVLFTGFLRGGDVERMFRMADLYVMPSVSEPFGIAPLEAISQDVPVIISKQSGVSEIITHALKVDFWDVDEMANKIVAVLRHPPLHATLRDHGSFEVSRLNWRDSAEACVDAYHRAIKGHPAPVSSR
jgi:glycosyltransferase involved in cell wall biosynthesis